MKNSICSECIQHINLNVIKWSLILLNFICSEALDMFLLKETNFEVNFLNDIDCSKGQKTLYVVYV